MPLICLASWVWKATMRTCLIAFSGEIPLLLKSLQSSLAWTREHSHNRWLFLFLQSQSCFLAPIPENSLAALPQGHTPVTLWLCLRYGCSLSLSLSLCFFCWCDIPVMPSPYIHVSNFDVASPVSLHGQKDTCWGFRWPLLSTWFQKVKQCFLS